MSQMVFFCVLIGGVTSLVVSLILVATKRYHGKLTLDSSEGVHKFHIAPTPRIGGIAIASGLFATLVLSNFYRSSLPTDVQGVPRLLGLMLLAGIPAFFFGILEDITKKVGVKARLFATMGSGLLACLMMDTSITAVDLPVVDRVLAISATSIAFTAFAVGGVANAFNIIDGFNGLASGTIIIALGAIGIVSYQAGDTSLAMICALVASTALGFACVNFPLGKIFLGDGGAYLFGFLTAWIAVMLPARNPEVSPWAPLLACGYPILEVLFSMWRKHHREGSHPGQPDRVHLHMLIYRRVSKHRFINFRPELQNGLTSLFAWSIALVPAGLSIVLARYSPALILLFLSSAAMYWLIYNRLTQFSWKAVATGRFKRIPMRRESSQAQEVA